LNTILAIRRNEFPAAAAVCAALIAVALGAGPAEAALYKWVDEKGVTHYTDTVPPEAVNKANVELNKQGTVIRKTDKAITPEEVKSREADAARQREEKKQQEDQARRDRALLDSYTTEADIDLGKARSIKIIENSLQSAEANSVRLAKRRDELLAIKAALGAKPVPPALARDIANTEVDIARQADYIAKKKEELVTVAARYDSDKARWQAIKARGTSASAAPAGSVAAAGAAPPKK